MHMPRWYPCAFSVRSQSEALPQRPRVHGVYKRVQKRADVALGRSQVDPLGQGTVHAPPIAHSGPPRSLGLSETLDVHILAIPLLKNLHCVAGMLMDALVATAVPWMLHGYRALSLDSDNALYTFCRRHG